MNNTMGRYIDSLTDEQRDRLLGAMEWIPAGAYRDDPDGPRCLVQHADWDGYWSVGRPWYVALRFDRAVDRFGLERVVRAIKLRAAAAMSTEVEREPQEAVA